MSAGQIFFGAVMALYAFYIVRWIYRRVAPPLQRASDRALAAKRAASNAIAAARSRTQAMMDNAVLAATSMETNPENPTPDEADLLRALGNQIRARARRSSK